MKKLEKLQQGKARPGLWLNFQYFKDHYQLIAVDLSKQKELDADPRAIQQIEFYSQTLSHKNENFRKN